MVKKALSDNEKLSLKYMKNKITKSERLKSEFLVPGTMLFYTYNPKDQDNPYDKTPLILVIARSKKHILGINFHWAPVVIRQKLLKLFMKANKTNISKKKPLEISKALSREMYRLCKPIFRKYLINRMSKRCAVIPPYEMGYVINLRAETFIGIDSTTAYKIALQKLRKK